VVRAIVRHADQLQDAIVRLRIDVPPERAGELREDDIRAQLKGAYHVAQFERTTRVRPRSRWGSAGEALQRAGPIEALTVYLEHQKVDPDRRALLIRHAKNLMGEDEPIESVEPVPVRTPPPGDGDIFVRTEADSPVIQGPPEGNTVVRFGADVPAEGVARPS
jgi:hypothetical protein